MAVIRVGVVTGCRLGQLPLADDHVLAGDTGEPQSLGGILLVARPDELGTRVQKWPFEVEESRFEGQRNRGPGELALEALGATPHLAR